MRSQATEARHGTLAVMCDERARILQDQVKVSMNHLQALAILVSTFHHSKSPSAIDQTTFARYVERTAFERPLTSGLAYAARVTHSERELFERQQAWSIRAMNFSSKRPRAEEYAPVIFAQDAYKHVVSIDMLSGAEDRGNLLRARESGKVVLTAPFQLLNKRIGVVLTYAVYKSELPLNATVHDRIQSSIGYLGGVFDIEGHVDKLLEKLAGKEPMTVNIYDTTGESMIRMYGSSNESASGMCHVSTLDFGDPLRKHEMHCRFTQGPPWPWLAVASSYGTLVISLLVGYIFHFTDKWIAKVEDGYKATDMQMPAKDEFAATERISDMERDLKEDALFFDTTKSPSLLEISRLLNHRDPAQNVHQEEQELNLPLEAQDKLKETERKLGRMSKFITKVMKLTSASIRCLHSRFHCFNKKVWSISLLGFLLFILVIGAFDQPYNQPLGMGGEGDNNMMLKNFGFSRGRLLIDTLHGTWTKRGVQSSDTIRVDLRKMTGNNDSSGQQLKHWSSHKSSEIPAVLYVPMNGKQVIVHCNLIVDEKALVNWISNGDTDQSSKYQKETAGIQNRTDKPHLPANKSHKTTVSPWIVLLPVIMLVLLGSIIWRRCNDHRRRVQQKELELLGIMGPSRFQLQDLVAATGNFADENKLGQGGFGPVYKGYLRDQDLHVAIKVLSRRQSCQEQSAQGLREFKAEVKVMTQLRHRNIVKLVGWSDSKKQLLLVYELMAQGSLDKHLYDPEKILTWQQRYQIKFANLFNSTGNFFTRVKIGSARYKIVLDLGSALLYLHHDCEKCIVHGDIKPANVMLDVSHNAKLGDFGLARLVEHGGEPQTTQVVAGTPGYIDPEFINNRWPRTELDVYSFGIVLLEIACGKRPASRQLPNGASSLLAWVRDLYDQGKILDAADQRLNGEFNQQQMERVIVMGLCCSHQDPIQRPSIVQAMDVLRSADAELPVPPAAHDTGHIRSMQEQAYADLPVEDHSVHTVTRSTYFTSKDSVYLLAEG